MNDPALHHGDMLDLLPGLPVVDLVFTSPPYEDARTYGVGFALKGDAWVNWAADRFMACLDRCRGAVCWVVAGRTRGYQWSATPALLMVELQRRGAVLRNPPVYVRDGIPGSGGPDWFKGRYELIVCATAKRARLPWSEPTAMGWAPKFKPGGAPSHHSRDGRVNRERPLERRRNGTRQLRIYRPPSLANPGNVIQCGPGGGNHMGSRFAHENEAPFPERLAEFFIRSLCPPGGTVLDPFVGSGTTCAVAARWGRRSIGIDCRESQLELTRRRMAELRAKSRGGVA